MPFLGITVVPVPTADKAAWLEHSRHTTPFFNQHGATAVTECWSEDVPDGKVTDFKRALDLQNGESVAVGWIAWADKATRDTAWAALMQDSRMIGVSMPFDGKRMIFAASRWCSRADQP